MSAVIPGVMRWTAIGLLVLALVPAALAAREFVKSRQASYYIQRQNALKRAVRWLAGALVAVVVAIVLLVVSQRLEAAPPESPAATSTPTVMPTSTATVAPVLTSAPTVTPTQRPTATAPPIPSPTPSVAPPPSALTPLPSAVPAREGAHIELLAMATAADQDGEPVDPRSEFRRGRHAVLLFFHYREMTTGTPVTFAWYKGEEFLDGCSDTWLWGRESGRQWGGEGTASLGCDPAGGWAAGNYEIRVFIETRLQGVAQFVVE